MSGNADTVVTMSQEAYATILSELRELHGDVRVMSSKLDNVVATGADHEQRLRVLETWKATLSGKLVALAAVTSVVVSGLVALLVRVAS